MNKKQGYILLFRSLFGNKIWKEDRTFSKAEAWIDLMRRAHYSEQPEWNNYLNGFLRRGDIYAPVRSLKKWWRWKSTSKVQRYLNRLEYDRMIKRKGSVIHLMNYNKYNPKKEKNNEN